LTALSSRWVPPVPKGLIAYGRTIEDWDYVIAYPYVAEGVSASVAVSDTFEGDRNFHVSGKVVASTIAIDMRLQRMLGHLPALVHPGPRSVLVVGCGAGVTAGSFVVHPGIESIVICEIEPRVVDAAREYFARENHGVLDDPRTEVILDDARHYLATTRRKFDIITADPIHPWVRGAAALYSTEFYELCKERLNPGGIVTQWLPLYETSEEAVKSELGLRNAYPVLVNVARLSRAKSQDDLLRAMPFVLERFPQAKLLIAGDGPQRAHLEHLRDAMGLGNVVVLLGWQSDVRPLLLAGDQFLFSSTALGPVAGRRRQPPHRRSPVSTCARATPSPVK
ncbi:MAG: glycosyltransferase, partial [Candidatus Hydrogenedentes bacterium]|nr:glycosyltransferase [Candidatus Hydrogenedentota bacterium]